MRILITGGAGYIGYELCHELAKQESVEEIIIYDNLSRNNYDLFLTKPFPKGKMRFVQGELLDTRKIMSLLDGIDIVYHLAAKVKKTFDYEEAHLFEQINHWGTAELVYAIEQSIVKKFIFLSTTSVYGSSEEPITIRENPNPQTFYGASKLRAEKHVERLFDKIYAYNIRCANVFGYSPCLRFDSVINSFMFDANFVGHIKIDGSGEQLRSFIHINKVVNVLKNIGFAVDFPSGTYNLVGKNLKINHVASLIKDLYPELNMVYVNQHLDMPGIQIQHDERLARFIDMKPQSIDEDFKQFKEKFAFSSFE